jgi:hypothetical protein
LSVTDYSQYFSSIYDIFTCTFCEDSNPITSESLISTKVTSETRDHKSLLKQMLDMVVGWNEEHDEKCDTRLFKVLGKSEVIDIVNDALSDFDNEEDEKNRWEPISNLNRIDWNLYWSWSSKPKLARNKMFIWQKVNHYYNSKQLTRKDLLVSSILLNGLTNHCICADETCE